MYHTHTYLHIAYLDVFLVLVSASFTYKIQTYLNKRIWRFTSSIMPGYQVPLKSIATHCNTTQGEMTDTAMSFNEFL